MKIKRIQFNKSLFPKYIIILNVIVLVMAILMGGFSFGLDNKENIEAKMEFEHISLSKYMNRFLIWWN